MIYKELIILVRAIFARDVYTLGLSAKPPADFPADRAAVRLKLLQMYDHCPEIRTRIKNILVKLDKEASKWKR